MKILSISPKTVILGMDKSKELIMIIPYIQVFVKRYGHSILEYQIEAGWLRYRVAILVF